MSIESQVTSEQLVVRLARAFGAAVAAYLRTGVVHSIDYALNEQDFVWAPVEDGTSPSDVSLWVGAGWADLVGDVAGLPNPATPGSSEQDLIQAIATQARQNPAFQRIALAIAAERMAAELKADGPDFSATLH